MKRKGHRVEPKAGSDWECQAMDPRGEAEAGSALVGEGFAGGPNSILPITTG